MNSSKIEASVKGYKVPIQDSDGNMKFKEDTMSSLKSKYEILEDNFLNLIRAIEASKKDFNVIENGKDEMFKKIDFKVRDLDDAVEKSIGKMDGEIRKSISQQKEENSRLQQQITSLKAEKTALQNQLIALQRRISDLEMQVGTDDVKF